MEWNGWFIFGFHFSLDWWRVNFIKKKMDQIFFWGGLLVTLSLCDLQHRKNGLFLSVMPTIRLLINNRTRKKNCHIHSSSDIKMVFSRFMQVSTKIDRFDMFSPSLSLLIFVFRNKAHSTKSKTNERVNILTFKINNI